MLHLTSQEHFNPSMSSLHQNLHFFFTIPSHSQREEATNYEYTSFSIFNTIITHSIAKFAQSQFRNNKKNAAIIAPINGLFRENIILDTINQPNHISNSLNLNCQLQIRTHH